MLSRFAKALVGMVMYNAETSEIAKPSELLVCVRTYMTVLQSVENYGESVHDGAAECGVLW